MGTRPNIKVVLDTNILIHYQTLQNINWLAEFDASEVGLFVPATVLRELNSLKDDPTSSYRDRAAKSIRRLNNMLFGEDKEKVREDVTIESYGDANINYSKFGLDKDIADSKIVACALELADESGEVPVCVVSDDIGVKAIVNDQSLIYFSALSDRYKLDRIEDSERAEIRELKKRNEKLRNREPKLCVSFPGGTEHEHSELSRPPSVSFEEKVQEKEKSIPEMCIGSVDKEGDITGEDFRTVSTSQKRKYNKQRREYLDDYRGWLEEKWWPARVRKSRELEMSLLLANSGGAPAESIEVHASCRGNFAISANGVELPEEPEPPERPEPGFSSITPDYSDLALPRIGNVSSGGKKRPELEVVPAEPGKAQMKRGELEYTVIITVPKLKHARSIELPSFFVEFHDYEDVTGFPIEVEAHADNLLEPIQSQLNVQVKMEGV